MKITKIYKHPTRKNKYVVNFDSGSDLELTSEVLLKFGLRSGDEIDEKAIDEIKQEQNFTSARDSSLRLISRRIRSEKEIIDKLKSKKYDEITIQKVLESLNKLNLLNDKDFANKFVSDSIHLKRPFGKLALKFKLQKFGIEKSTASDGINELMTEETEVKLAYDAASKKLRLLKKHPKEKQKQRIYSFLAQRGFNYDIVRKVMNKLDFEIEE
jgi:regulatory protein